MAFRRSRLDGGHIWSGIGHDIRDAARRLAGQRGTTAFTILTLASAIGVAAAVFSIVDQLILRPPPFMHADRLVNVWHQTGPGRAGGGGLTAEKIVGWEQQTAIFERLEGYIGASFDLTDATEPERISARVVSLRLFDMLGITVRNGRPFMAGDGAPGSEKVAIISHEFWRSRLGGSPGAVGSELTLNDERYRIVGVLNPGTTLLTDDEPVWLPMDLTAWGARAPHRFFGIGRLNPALSVANARSAADTLAAELGKSRPLAGTWYLGIDAKRSAVMAATTRQAMFVLLGAVTVLLVIACVNVTSFCLGQAVRRERELRLRAALGAGRWSLLRASLVETLLVAAAAGVAATAMAHLALALLLAAGPAGIASMQTRPLEIDSRVLAVMTLVTLTVGLMAGIVPAIRSSRIDLSRELRDGTGGSSRGLAFDSSAGVLVVVEVALATVGRRARGRQAHEGLGGRPVADRRRGRRQRQVPLGHRSAFGPSDIRAARAAAGPVGGDFDRSRAVVRQPAPDRESRPSGAGACGSAGAGSVAGSGSASRNVHLRR
jgi:predicted permease